MIMLWKVFFLNIGFFRTVNRRWKSWWVREEKDMGKEEKEGVLEFGVKDMGEVCKI